jgi:CBS domain-containing protein
MAYLSEIIGKPVVDVDGRRVGRVDDLVATPDEVMPHPRLSAVCVRTHAETIVVPIEAVAVLTAPAVSLTKPIDEVVPVVPGEGDLRLVRDVLDRQIIDTDGVRLVRVNDIELARVDQRYFVANVDVGMVGLLRRLGLARAAERLWLRRRGSPPGKLTWHAVEFLPGDQPLRLRVPGSKFEELHPADLAEIISDLSRAQSTQLLSALDVETVADALEEVEPEFQASLMEGLSSDRAADVLEAMAPDEAADLVAELEPERRSELLPLVEREKAEEIESLLRHPEDTAGGIMTTEYLAVADRLTATDVMALLRRRADEVGTPYYIYVTDDEGILTGVLALFNLMVAAPEARVSEFMNRNVVSVPLLATQDEVARAVAKYNLMAIPVVDEGGRLVGIVTADDALDKIIPTRWKKRLPRLYR